MADGFVYTQCITLRNGKRLCKPPGKVFRFKANDNYKPKKPNESDDES